MRKSAFKIITTEQTIKQRDGKDSDIHVTRTQYIPSWYLKVQKTKGKKKPIDYGVTEEQFLDILKRAAQPKDNKDDVK